MFAWLGKTFFQRIYLVNEYCEFSKTYRLYKMFPKIVWSLNPFVYYAVFPSGTHNTSAWQTLVYS